MCATLGVFFLAARFLAARSRTLRWCAPFARALTSVDLRFVCCWLLLRARFPLRGGARHSVAIGSWKRALVVGGVVAGSSFVSSPARCWVRVGRELGGESAATRRLWWWRAAAPTAATSARGGDCGCDLSCERRSVRACVRAVAGGGDAGAGAARPRTYRHISSHSVTYRHISSHMYARRCRSSSTTRNSSTRPARPPPPPRSKAASDRQTHTRVLL